MARYSLCDWSVLPTWLEIAAVRIDGFSSHNPSGYRIILTISSRPYQEHPEPRVHQYNLEGIANLSEAPDF